MTDTVVVNFSLIRTRCVERFGVNSLPVGRHFIGSEEIPTGIDFVERSFQVTAFGNYSVPERSRVRLIDCPLPCQGTFKFDPAPLWLSINCRVCQTEANLIINQELVPGYSENSKFVFCDSEGRPLRIRTRRGVQPSRFYHQEEKTICQSCVIQGCLRTRSWS
uniref:Putative movement protein n=1 Tax=Soybean yellow common mosaic virus TaxID=1080798 RepID=A0A0B5JD45_9VIRU|nr:putative movement protein [Soybean yellow common mosaic virus]